MLNLANSMTLLNLLCGCMAVVSIQHQRVDHAFALVLAAGIIDFFDGFVARALKQESALGRELDSLADVVSFGLVPGLMLVSLMQKASFPDFLSQPWLFTLFKYSPFIVTLFTALRLARFNVDTEPKSYFTGVPSPMNGMALMGLPFLLNDFQFTNSVLRNPLILLGISLLCSGLLIAELPMLSLKFKSLRWPENKSRYLLLAISALLLLRFGRSAGPFILLFYVFLSLLDPPLRKSPS